MLITGPLTYPANTGLDPHEFLTAETINHLGTQKEIGEGLKAALSTGKLQLQLLKRHKED